MSVIIGGIGYNTPFIMTYRDGSGNYFLSSYAAKNRNGNNVTAYGFVKDSSTPSVFYITFSTSERVNDNDALQYFNFYDTSIGGGIYIDIDQFYINESVKTNLPQVSLFPASYPYSVPPLPENNKNLLPTPPTGFSLLANVGYRFNSLFRFGSSSVAYNIVFVPVTAYLDCSITPYITTNTAAQALSNWQKIDTNANPPKVGWTTQSDCKVGVNYSYCLGSALCGANNCNGNCFDPTNYVCMYTPSTSLFSCLSATGGVEPPPPPPKPGPSNSGTPWYKSTWFIIAIVLLIFGGIGFFIIAFIIHMRRKKAAAEG